jgi:hypothetical protein
MGELEQWRTCVGGYPLAGTSVWRFGETERHRSLTSLLSSRSRLRSAIVHQMGEGSASAYELVAAATAVLGE